MNNMLSMLFNMFNQNNSNQNINCNTQNHINCQNQNPSNSFYPEVFFTHTNANVMSNSNMLASPSPAQQNQQGLGGLLNGDLLKNLLPLVLGKGDSKGLSNILGNGNNNLSQIFSMFSGKNKKKEKKEESSQESKPSNDNVIDLSDYTEIN